MATVEAEADDRESRVRAQLGALLSEHPPSASFGRGWPAFLSAGVLASVFTVAGLAFAYHQESLRGVGGALVMGAFAVAMLKTALEGRASGAWVFERGLLVKAPRKKTLVPWDEVTGWTVHAVPGIKKRYEEDFANVVGLTVAVGDERVEIPDQLTDFRALHDAIERHVGAPPIVARRSRR